MYLFRDGRGEVLYVGKAADLRARVRSYFSTDDRRKVGTSCARRGASTTRCAPTGSKRPSGRSGSSTSTFPGTTARARGAGSIRT
ncbi:MAG: hypothetical protein R2695_15780 [Acidimicrobiales bacterium]